MSAPSRARRLFGRVAVFVLTVLGAAALVSLLLALAPGDAADLAGADAAATARLREAWQLDGSLPHRVGAILARWAGGDLGTSWTVRPGAPVRELLLQPAGRSLGLLTGAFALLLPCATLLAWLGDAGRPLRILARATSVAPAFLLAHLAIVGLNALTFDLMQRGLVARPDWFALPDAPSALRTALAAAILAVGSGTLADVHDTLAASLKTLRQSAWVEAARGRGEPLLGPLARHLVPTLATVVAVRTAWLLGGLVIVEQVMQIRGLGALFWRAAELRDAELAAALALIAAFVVAAVRLLCEAVRLLVDPRLGADRVA